MQRDRMAHGDVLAEIDAPFFFHAVEDAVVLDVGVGADADFVHVAAQDGVHPNRRVLAEDDVADDLCRVVDVAGGGDGGGRAFEGANHFERECVRMVRPVSMRFRVHVKYQPSLRDWFAFLSLPSAGSAGLLSRRPSGAGTIPRRDHSRDRAATNWPSFAAPKCWRRIFSMRRSGSAAPQSN